MLIELKCPELPKWETFRGYAGKLKDIRFRRHNPPSLKHIQGNDYQLKPNQLSAWVSIDNIVVYMRRTTNGTVLTVYNQEEEVLTGEQFYPSGEKPSDRI